MNDIRLFQPQQVQLGVQEVLAGLSQSGYGRIGVGKMAGSEVQVAEVERHRVIEGPTDGSGALKATGTRAEHSLGELVL